MDPKLKEKLLRFQCNELTEYIIYKKLSQGLKNKENSGILAKLSEEELAHYNFFKSITLEDSRPNAFKIFIYVFFSRVFGLNFSLRLMESGEDSAQELYGELKDVFPQIEKIINDEEEHETELISLINEERLKYISSMVLGLNDALVELTGALAGFTLAIQKAKLIGVIGLITGIAASMSMAASEYLSTKEEETDKNPLKASVYTVIAYAGTVVFLVIPYFIFSNIFICLACVIFNALLIIIIFTFYISVAKNLNFKKRLLEMAGLSLSIAVINFFIGLAIKKIFGIEV